MAVEVTRAVSVRPMAKHDGMVFSGVEDNIQAMEARIYIGADGLGTVKAAAKAFGGNYDSLDYVRAMNDERRCKSIDFEEERLNDTMIPLNVFVKTVLFFV